MIGWRSLARGVVDFYVAAFISMLLAATTAMMLTSIWLAAAWVAGEVTRVVTLAGLLYLATRYPPSFSGMRYRSYVVGIVAPALASVGFILAHPNIRDAGPRPQLIHVVPFVGAVAMGTYLGGKARARQTGPAGARTRASLIAARLVRRASEADRRRREDT